MGFSISVALHLVGIVFWLGGLIVITRLVALAAKKGVSSSDIGPLAGRLFKGYVLAGLVLATVAGVYQLLDRGMGFYFAQGWFHTKITLVLILYVVTAILWADLNNLNKGVAVSPKKSAALHGVTALILVLAVFLTIIGRVGGV